MDFGKILDQWDKQSGQVYDKDAKTASPPENPADRRRRLLRKRPDGTIDLHGLTRDEAWDALEAFFKDAKDKGLEKLLVIHGKGNHAPQSAAEGLSFSSRETGILAKTVREFLERYPFAGESGRSSAPQGGSGSTWVLLKD
jgi:DNA-nicking Smr family endonuclease